MIEVAAAVIVENGKVLMANRPVDKPPAGWEFPGGKLEPGETVADAAKRELLEELALDIEPQEILHTMENDRLRLNFILAGRMNDSIPSAREGQQFKWVPITSQPPAGVLANDLEFWKILYRYKIKDTGTPL